MSATFKINLDLLSPASPLERKALTDAITATAEILANTWDTLHQTETSPQLEKITVNFSTVFGPGNEHLHTQLKTFTHKFANGRTVRITPEPKE